MPKSTSDAPKKVLIVDDHEDLLEIYSTTLRRAGFDVLTASLAMNGVEIAKEKHPDLILLDIMMPEVDGLTALKILKLDPVTAAVPVVMLTNLPEESGMEQAKQLGALDYILKVHLDPTTIVAKVREFLNEKK